MMLIVAITARTGCDLLIRVSAGALSPHGANALSLIEASLAAPVSPACQPAARAHRTGPDKMTRR